MRARHEGAPRTCLHCGEPVVRLQADGARQVSKWLHTPNRLHCLNAWREVTGMFAEPRQMVLPGVGVAA